MIDHKMLDETEAIIRPLVSPFAQCTRQPDQTIDLNPSRLLEMIELCREALNARAAKQE